MFFDVWIFISIVQGQVYQVWLLIWTILTFLKERALLLLGYSIVSVDSRSVLYEFMNECWEEHNSTDYIYCADLIQILAVSTLFSSIINIRRLSNRICINYIQYSDRLKKICEVVFRLWLMMLQESIFISTSKTNLTAWLATFSDNLVKRISSIIVSIFG